MIARICSIYRIFGLANGFWYVIARALDRLGGGFGLYKYSLVAQPVPVAPMLSPARGKTIIVREVARTDAALAALPVEAEVLRSRFDQDAICFGAFAEEALIGCLWLCRDGYDEDEIRCRFVPEPPSGTVWDFDVYVDPAHRIGFAFARLWDAAFAEMRHWGVEWSVSRISDFNPASAASHTRMGAQRIGGILALTCGTWQLTFASTRPRVHLSRGPRNVPAIRLPVAMLMGR